MPASNIENALSELNRQLAERPIAKLAFMQMSKARQHEFLKHVAEPKKTAERSDRIKKSLDTLEAWWAANRTFRKN